MRETSQALRGVLGGLLATSTLLWTGAVPTAAGVAQAPGPRRSAALDLSQTSVAPAAASTCAEVIVYVVRGSGEKPQPGPATYGETWDAFDPIDPETEASSIDADRVLDVDESGRRTVDTKTPFLYDLVQKIHERVGGQLRLSWAPIKYPAVPVSEFNPGFALWLVHGYPNSVTAGIRELHRTLKRQWELCGDQTRYVLAGYSQGADVVDSYLRGKIVTGSSTFGLATVHEFLGPTPEIMGQIASVALIADPNHDPGDAESYSDEDDRLAQTYGLVGAVRAGVPKQVVGVTDSMCLAGDSVCGRGVKVPSTEGNKIHEVGYRDFLRYPVECHLADEPDDDVSVTTCLADRTVERLGVQNLIRHPLDESVSAPGSSGRDVAFFIDTTGSMQDDIDSALSFASNQADRIVALDGRVALVQYRDSEDDLPVEIVTPFTTDMTEFQNGLATLLADGGGDDPEGLLHALMVGFDGLDWQYGATKAVVVLTDADFHEPDLTGGETLPLVERRSLEIDPVNVFPVVEQVGRYDDLAARTSGEVITNDGGDTELALGLALDNIAARPIAVLSNGTYRAAPGGVVHFDASGSSASSSLIDEYQWDLDGDGFTEEVTTEPTINHTYPAGYSGLMQVFVVDDLGRSANASASVLVDEEPPVTVAPVVPTATRMQADAQRDDDHVLLDVSWDPGAEEPERWVIALDDDPVTTAEGGADHVTVAVEQQPDPWTISLVPMDVDGNYGAPFEAELDPVTAGRPWYRRAEVWGAATLAGLLGAVGPWWLVHRRRRRSVTAPGMVT